jgi:hypothetical protein
MIARIVSRRAKSCSKVLLLASMLWSITDRPVSAQTSNNPSTTQTASPGLPGPQAPSDTSASGAGNSGSVPVNTPGGAQSQPFNVNPLTGLTSTSAANYRPLTGKERWNLYWKQNYLSTGAYVGPVFTALILDQASNSPSAWGGGVEGYGRRLGSRIATSITQGTIQAAVAARLHQDVRYIASAEKGFKRRSMHAIAFSFLTYNSKGHTTLNIANLSSYYAATAISTSWVPISGNKGKYTLTNGSAQVLLAIPINFLQEFWPEIRHTILRHP